ncbi:hypothetical protein [Sutcliffiella deserti]|uniref:hypothetical protein n=1 Tax=Sutcliffiella deserti TaxID=2875501 RepID=UPI001CBAAE9A|nr:hypothetical protein [Sutcliffiella deserti]
MAKLLKSAIQDVRNFYIQKLIDGGHQLDLDSLSSYTLSELKGEYTSIVNKEQKNHDSIKSNNRYKNIPYKK